MLEKYVGTAQTFCGAAEFEVGLGLASASDGIISMVLATAYVLRKEQDSSTRFLVIAMPGTTYTPHAQRRPETILKQPTRPPHLGQSNLPHVQPL
jgi:hypothetical protein